MTLSIPRIPLIIGLGKTGLSCARFLARKHIAFAVMDTRESPPFLNEFRAEFPDVPLHLGSLNNQWLAAANEVIASPGIALPCPAISDIELFARHAKAPTIGITGTNAKGTVTTLVGEMIKASGFTVAVGGNIGTPALDLVTENSPDFYVLEISSFQLETTNYLPLKVACILNISPDHLDRHGSLENYVNAKQRIYQRCDHAVYNIDDKQTLPKAIYAKKIKKCWAFGKTSRYTEYLSPKDLKTQGAHNWINIIAAMTIGEAIGLPINKMIEAAKIFPGLPHRCEWIASKNNITWYDDSKGTNVGATLAALNGLGDTLIGKIVLIAGGLGKDADFSILQPAIKKYVRCVILIGRDANVLANAFALHTTIQFAASLQEAVYRAGSCAARGDAVLLSPACASFDMFQDYTDRGRQFQSIVKEYLSHGL